MTTHLPDDVIRNEDGQPVAVLAAEAGLSEVPGAIARMRQLRHVDLDGNTIRRLPASVATLPQLHTLLLPDALGLASACRRSSSSHAAATGRVRVVLGGRRRCAGLRFPSLSSTGWRR